MTTFKEARAIVLAELRPYYNPAAGLYISFSGLENAESYQLFARVSKKGYTAPEDGAHVVDKATGEYRYEAGQYVIPDAQPCGEPLPT